MGAGFIDWTSPSLGPVKYGMQLLAMKLQAITAKRKLLALGDLIMSFPKMFSSY
jgi:hypothetical protein